MKQHLKNHWPVWLLTLWVVTVIGRGVIDHITHTIPCNEAGGLYTHGKCIEVTEIDY